MVDTRDRIIVATNELFRRQGYNGTTLSQISKAAEATVGSIYHFFPGGKEALAVAVIESTGAIYCELFVSIVTQVADPAVAYAEFFAGAATVLEESGFIDPCPVGTVAREVANTSDPIRIAAKNAFNSWIEAASQHLVGAGVMPEDADRLAQVFVATVEGMFVLSRTQRSTAPLLSAGLVLSRLVDQAISEATTAHR